MPAVTIYFKDEEYGKFLREAQKKGIPLPKHLKQKIKGVRENGNDL